MSDYQMIFVAAVLAWYLAEASEPLQELKAWMMIPEDSLFARLLSCSLCTGFWVGFVLTGDLFGACAASVLAEALSRAEKLTRTI